MTIAKREQLLRHSPDALSGPPNVVAACFFDGKDRPRPVKMYLRIFAPGEKARRGTEPSPGIERHPMLIDVKEAMELADMLRIKLSEADARRLAVDMSSVLDYVGLLGQLDVSGVDPMGVGSGGYADLRDDVVGPCLSPADLETLSGGAYDPELGAFVTKAIFS